MKPPTPADMTTWTAKLLERPLVPPLGSPENPIIVPPALYDAIKADPRFADVSIVKNLPLPYAAVIARGD